MEIWRTVLVIATIAGFLITIGGLIAAFVAAGREFRDASTRVDKMEELADAVRAETRAVRTPPSSDEEFAANEAAQRERNLYWEEEYARHGLTRPTYNNMVFLAAYESRRLLGLVLKSTRRDFLIAAFGLLVSTIASVGSLFLTS